MAAPARRVDTGPAMVREMGGDGFVAYPLVSDAVNTGSRLEGLAPVGGVLIGDDTPPGCRRGPWRSRAPRAGQGQGRLVAAYVLHALSKGGERPRSDGSVRDQQPAAVQAGAIRRGRAPALAATESATIARP